MQALILAAGMGRRLGELTKNNTKCMVEVNGVPLIKRMLGQLDKLSLNRIVIVVGYEGSSLVNYILSLSIKTPIIFVNNPIYDKTNNIYSLALAKKQLIEDDTLLIESDLIFEDSLFPYIINNKYPNLALVDRYEPWMDGTMVRIDDECNIVNFIPKKAFKYSDIAFYYKTVNIYKFSKEFLETSYIPFLEAYTKALGNNEYYEQVLRVITLLDNCELKALPLNGEKWYEIDDVQDLDIAETLFAEDDKKLSLYQKRYGGYWRFPSIKDFCYLVNPYFPSARMKEEIKANFDKLLTEYPSGLAINNLIMAKNFCINKDYICTGNGAAELIKSLMESLRGNIGIVYPTFEEYPNRRNDETIIPYLPNNKDFSYSANDLIDFFKQKNIKSLLLINPDNPSGNFISQKEVLRLSQWCQDKNINFILDESFVDFSKEGHLNSLLSNEILEKYNNLIVIKSISKSYGVPGLRLGLLATSNTNIIDYLKKDVSIWNINSFAEFYLQVYSKYEAAYIDACERFRSERNRFYERLSTIPYLFVIPSQANYFLCEVTNKYTSKELAELLLNQYNILIKDCGTKAAFNGRNYIRIAIRDQKDNDLLIDALVNL